MRLRKSGLSLMPEENGMMHDPAGRMHARMRPAQEEMEQECY